MSIRRGGLGLRLFLSHLVVLAVGIILVLGVAGSLTPTLFEVRMTTGAGPGLGRGPGAGMGVGPGGRAGEAGMGTGQVDVALEAAFRGALLQGLLVGGAGAGLAAIVASLLLTRRLVGPIERLDAASHRVAEGRYGERVPAEGTDELARLGQSFNTMAETLEQTEQRRTALIGDVAHELRTPIATLRGYLEGLLDGVVPPEPRTWARLDAEAGRLQRLVDDLQQLSRAEAHQMAVSLQPVEPSLLVRQAVERFADGFAEKHVTLAVDSSPPLPSVLADQGRAVQVLTNLLANALRYTPDGGTVRVATQLQGDRVEFRVTDTGIGIAPEHLPRLFERFYRADPARSRAQGGSGIGLTISRALVEAMGGEIAAESAGPGQGATFRFTLPVARAGTTPTRSVPPDPAPIG